MEIHEISNTVVRIKVSIETSNHVFGFIDNYDLNIGNLHKHELENIQKIIKHYKEISDRRYRNRMKKVEEKKE